MRRLMMTAAIGLTLLAGSVSALAQVPTTYGPPDRSETSTTTTGPRHHADRSPDPTTTTPAPATAAAAVDVAPRVTG